MSFWFSQKRKQGPHTKQLLPGTTTIQTKRKRQQPNIEMGDNYAYGETEYGLCPSWALSLGYLGVASGAVLSNWGSAVSFIIAIDR